jgi:hypothetical protein
VATAALAAGYEPAPAGVAVALAVVVATGMRLLLAPRWADALVPAVGGGVLAALALATGDPLALGVTVAVVGGVLTAEALVARSLELGVPGVGICVLGTWQVLAATDVEALDAWAAPVAAALLAGGAVVRHRDRTGSWLAYAPPVALLGGAALAERVADGPGVHALVVGAVGVAAVALGGARRLVGPLVSGTVLLVALTVHESLTLTAAVPTWAWLALGGTTLIGVGVGLERRDTGPFEAGQRLARVVRERYS